MACGRLKNLEIAARNLLCSLRDGRRNFPTTRDGNRRRGNPEPPGKGQLRAFGQGEVRRHRQGGNSGPPVRGKPRACGEEETLSRRQGGNPGPPGIGRTPGPLASAKARCRPVRGEPARGTSSHRRRENFKVCGEGGNPESYMEKKALGRRRRENFKLCGGGETPSRVMRGKPRATRRRENFKICGGGETPSHVWRRKL